MKIRIASAGFNLTPELERYTRRKLARITKKVPRNLRVQTLCKVEFTQVSRKGKKFNTCLIELNLDGAKLRAEETTLHRYIALDIAVVHIERQLVDYVARRRRSLRARLMRLLRTDWM